MGLVEVFLLKLFLNERDMPTIGNFDKILNLFNYKIESLKNPESCYDTYKKIKEINSQDIKQQLIQLLCTKYLFFRQKSDPKMVDYLRENDLKNILERFNTEKTFGIKLLLNYVNTFNNKSQNELSINEEIKFNPNVKLATITDLIREAFLTLYTDCKLIGYNDDAFIVFLYGSLNVYDEVKSISQITNVLNVLLQNKSILARIIYADVFADIYANGKEQNTKKNVVNLTTQALLTENYSLELSKEDFKQLMQYFIYLVQNEEKRKYNYAQLSNEDFIKLRRINPISIIEKTAVIRK